MKFIKNGLMPFLYTLAYIVLVIKFLVELNYLLETQSNFKLIMWIVFIVCITILLPRNIRAFKIAVKRYVEKSFF